MEQRYLKSVESIIKNMFFMLDKINKNKSNRQGKRRLATLEGVKVDLKDEIPLLFEAFEEARRLYDQEVAQTPPFARGRSFEANLYHAKIVQCMQKKFPDKWESGRYGRYVFRINGYIILCKKMNDNNFPMNIRTDHSDAISHQLSLSLYDSGGYLEEPILYFGYKENDVGFELPQLVYIDEGKVKWVMESENITESIIEIDFGKKDKVVAQPTLKKAKKKKAK